MLLTSVVGSEVAYGQSRTLNDRMPAMRWSVDLRVGAGLPITPTKPNNEAYAWAQPAAQIGLRYMITRTIGIRPSYGYQRYRHDSTDDGLDMHLIGADLIYSLSDVFPEQRVGDRRWNVLVHAGGYYNHTKVRRTTLEAAALPDDPPVEVLQKDRDRMVSLSLGATAQYRLNQRVTLTGDLSLYGNFLQQHGYHGEGIKHGRFTPGLVLYPSIGVQYALGKGLLHADWR